MVESLSSSSLNARAKILALFAKNRRIRLTPAEILRRGGFGRDDLQSILESLKELAREGQIVRLKKNHYALPEGQNLLTGRVHAHPDGYGFLIPENGAEDLYLNRREMRRVMHGDRVMVRIDRNQRGRVEAHITQIIERAHKKLLGTYDEFDGQSYLIPMDPRIATAISLKRTGDKPEKGAVIAAEISRYATAMSPPEATLVAILGNPDDPEVQAQSLIFRYGLSTSFLLPSPATNFPAEPIYGICPLSPSMVRMRGISTTPSTCAR